MHQYHQLLDRILSEGIDKDDRTGTGTRSIFGHQMRFDLGEGFPLLTTKRVHFKSVAEELFWFLRGETNVRSLQAAGVSIWDEWADENGELGPVYGHQWRSWGTDPEIPFGGVDQLANVVEQLSENPDSRRLIVTAWNPAEIDDMALPPCHCLFQFYTAPMSLDERGALLAEARGEPIRLAGTEAMIHGKFDTMGVPRRRLSCQLYQRSADVFLGVPFNIASYALLAHMVAQVAGMAVGEFVHTLGDAHLYRNHLDQAREQLKREPRPLPKLRLDPSVADLFAFRFEDIEVVGYRPHPHIAAPVAV